MPKVQPETYKLITPFFNHLKAKDKNWRKINIHGNDYTGTLPDVFFINPSYEQKLVEFKIRYGNTIHLSPNQKSDWPVYIGNGLKFWVIAAADLRGEKNYCLREKMYRKLFEPPNCHYLLSSYLYRRLW